MILAQIEKAILRACAYSVQKRSVSARHIAKDARRNAGMQAIYYYYFISNRYT
jgi:transcription termination factor NusB